uniref:Uncharacterized protein n=1 Tax=Romanomermis culicivorax TaxID=13658 RepID=A0A915I7W4_ROMCU
MLWPSRFIGEVTTIANYERADEHTTKPMCKRRMNPYQIFFHSWRPSVHTILNRWDDRYPNFTLSFQPKCYGSPYRHSIKKQGPIDL